jgi:preprotein translocase subunit SecG
MSAALIILGGAVFIALSIFFHFMPRLRVVAALLVGGLLTGAVARQVNEWLADGIGQIAKPIGKWIGQDSDDVALAIPSAIAFALAIVVVVFMRKGKGGGITGGKGASAGKGGGGGRSGKLAYVALVCALLLPIILGGLGETIRDVVA